MKIKRKLVNLMFKSTLASVVAVMLSLLVLPLIPVSAAPADAYWVGDGGNWSDAATHWATVSGGAPGGGNLPDATTDTHFDGSSFTIGGQTVTVDVNASTGNMDWTGATNTPTLDLQGGINIDCYGHVTFISAMATSGIGSFKFNGAAKIITSNGLTLSFAVFMNSGSHILADDFETTANINFYTSLDFAGFNLTGAAFVDNGVGGAKTLTLGAGTLTTGSITMSGANLTLTLNSGIIISTAFVMPAAFTINAGTSTIKVSGTGAFDGTGKTYNNVELNGTAHTISGSNTYDDLKFNRAGIQTITFTDGTTQTVNTLTRDGGVDIKTLQGTGAGGWNVTDADGGTNNLEYISISRSTAAPINTFYAGASSTDGLNNTDWFFNDQPLTFTTQAASGVTMTRDAVTGGNFNGTLGALVGTHNTSTWIDYGLTDAYGTSTAPVNRTTTGAFVVAIPVGLIPGQTYNYRFSGSNDAGTFNGNNQTFTFTMPDITTIEFTGQLGDVTTDLQGNTTAMGVATGAYVGIQYGLNTGYGTLSATTTIAGTGITTTTIGGYDSSRDLYYRSFARVGGVYSYGTGYIVGGGRADAFALLRNVLSVGIAAVMLVFVIRTFGDPVAMLTSVVIGIMAIAVVQGLIG